MQFHLMDNFVITRQIHLGHFLHSRIPPVENGPFRLDSFSTGLLVFLPIVTQVDFIDFVLFLEAVGVREYCCMVQ